MAKISESGEDRVTRTGGAGEERRQGRKQAQASSIGSAARKKTWLAGVFPIAATVPYQRLALEESGYRSFTKKSHGCYSAVVEFSVARFPENMAQKELETSPSRCHAKQNPQRM